MNLCTLFSQGYPGAPGIPRTDIKYAVGVSVIATLERILDSSPSNQMGENKQIYPTAPDPKEIAQNRISSRQIADYRENGYHIIRGVLSAEETAEYRRLVRVYVKTDRHEMDREYPEPAKYTVAGNAMAKPGLASIAEHPYSNASYNSLSDAGKRLIPIHFDDPISSARLLIENTSEAEPLFLLRRSADNGSWELPGGESQEEEEKVGWDIGSRIGALQSIVEEQLNVNAIPWMSYIEDIQSDGGVCRVYGYRDSNGSLKSSEEKLDRCEWFTAPTLRKTLGENHAINRIVRSWQRKDFIRSKGKAGRQQKQQFD